MFDRLVESAKQKQGRRARRIFFATGAVYAVALTTLGIAAIIVISPALAEEYDVLSILIPPPVPPGPAPEQAPKQQNLKQAPDTRFVAPERTTQPPELDELKNLKPIQQNLVPGGAKDLTGIGREGVIPGARDTGEEPPPPPPTPTPVVKPAATPAPDQVVRLTSRLTQGRVLRRVQPPYPVIARQAHVQGTVQVQIASPKPALSPM
jgi:hypothetical protein